MKKVVVPVSILVCVSAFGVALQLARAEGVPSPTPLIYKGLLEDVAGAPLTGTKNIALAVYDAASGGTKRCEVDSKPYTLVNGRFSIQLPDTCTSATGVYANLWVDVSVDGASLGRAKVGAVPYALQAGTASAAAGALKNEIGWRALYAAATSVCFGYGATPPNEAIVLPRGGATCTATCTAQAVHKTCKSTIALQLQDIAVAPTQNQQLSSHYSYSCDNTSASNSPIGKSTPYNALYSFCCCS